MQHRHDMSLRKVFAKIAQRAHIFRHDDSILQNGCSRNNLLAMQQIMLDAEMLWLYYLTAVILSTHCVLLVVT